MAKLFFRFLPTQMPTRTNCDSMTAPTGEKNISGYINGRY
jgi:hypothetical protein